MRFHRYAAVLTTLLACAPSVAALIPDQQQTSGFLYGAAAGGQSFRPGLPAIDFISLSLATTAGAPLSFTVSLLEGDGFAGQVLATSNVVPVNEQSGEFTTFFFAQRLELKAGNAYSFRVSSTDQRYPSFGLGISRSDLYAGGRYYDAFGTAVPQFDLRFIEGIDDSRSPSVPEPATWAMMVAGFGGIGAAIRRRKMIARLA